MTLQCLSSLCFTWVASHGTLKSSLVESRSCGVERLLETTFSGEPHLEFRTSVLVLLTASQAFEGHSHPKHSAEVRFPGTLRTKALDAPGLGSRLSCRPLRRRILRFLQLTGSVC